LRRASRNAERNRVIEYDADGIQLLAIAVIREAVEDHTGRAWIERFKKWKTKKVSRYKKESAFRFLSDDTKRLNNESLLEFCCGLAKVDVEIIKKGVFGDIQNRNDKNPTVRSRRHN
jgi:hypothetical protein